MEKWHFGTVREKEEIKLILRNRESIYFQLVKKNERSERIVLHKSRGEYKSRFDLSAFCPG